MGKVEAIKKIIWMIAEQEPGSMISISCGDAEMTLDGMGEGRGII